MLRFVKAGGGSKGTGYVILYSIFIKYFIVLYTYIHTFFTQIYFKASTPYIGPQKAQVLKT